VSGAAEATKRAAAAVAGRQRLTSGDNPLVRVVGRVPVKLHTKLLVAFVGTALLVVTIGLVGLRILGQSNDRVAGLGALQERASAYGKLQSDAFNIRVLLAENVAGDFYRLNNPALALPRGRDPTSVDEAAASALARIGPATSSVALGFVPPREDQRVLAAIRAKSARLSRVVHAMVASDKRGPSREQIRLHHAAEQLASTSTSSPPNSRTTRRQRPAR
jgi:hypothetical protein